MKVKKAVSGGGHGGMHGRTAGAKVAPAGRPCRETPKRPSVVAPSTIVPAAYSQGGELRS